MRAERYAISYCLLPTNTCVLYTLAIYHELTKNDINNNSYMPYIFAHAANDNSMPSSSIIAGGFTGALVMVLVLTVVTIVLVRYYRCRRNFRGCKSNCCDHSHSYDDPRDAPSPPPVHSIPLRVEMEENVAYNRVL